MDLIPFNVLTDKIKIYTLVYDEHLSEFINLAREGALVSIANLDREVKDVKRQLFNTFIFRGRNFKVYDGSLEDLGLNFYQNNPETIKKRITYSKYLKQSKPLRIESLNPYMLIRHCVKVQCKFIKIAYLKIERCSDSAPLDEAVFTC
jgi:hypothetical protein